MNDNSNSSSNNNNDNKRIDDKSQIRSMGTDKIVPTFQNSDLPPPMYT